MLSMLARGIRINGWKQINAARQIHTSAALNALFPKMPNEQKHRKVDQVDLDYDLIYGFEFPRTVQFAKHGSTLALLATPAFLIKYMINEFRYITEELTLSERIVDIAINDDSDFVAWMMLLIVNAWLVRRVSIKIPLRIYRKDNTYVAIFEGVRPFTKHKLNFKTGEVTEHFNAWTIFRALTYKIKDTTVLFMPQYFKRHSSLHEMLRKDQKKKYMFISNSE